MSNKYNIGRYMSEKKREYFEKEMEIWKRSMEMHQSLGNIAMAEISRINMQSYANQLALLETPLVGK